MVLLGVVKVLYSESSCDMGVEEVRGRVEKYRSNLGLLSDQGRAKERDCLLLDRLAKSAWWAVDFALGLDITVEGEDEERNQVEKSKAEEYRSNMRDGCEFLNPELSFVDQNKITTKVGKTHSESDVMRALQYVSEFLLYDYDKVECVRSSIERASMWLYNLECAGLGLKGLGAA